jgi:hypothetical protein
MQRARGLRPFLQQIWEPGLPEGGAMQCRAVPAIEVLEGRRLLSASAITLEPIASSRAAAAAVTVAPAGHGVTLNLIAGQPFSGSLGTFTGITPAREARFTISAIVHWGDGSAASAGDVSIDSAGTISISGSHTYARAGRHPIAVSILGRPVAQAGRPAPKVVVLLGIIHSKAVIGAATTSAPPVNSTGGVTLQEAPGVAFTASIGTFITLAPATNLQASVTWGDGSSSNGTVKADGVIGIDEIQFEVDGTHTYANVGTYPIHVVVYKPGPTPTSVARLITTIDSTAIVASATSLSLNGTITGKYSLAPTAITIGPGYIFTGTGTAGVMGNVSAQASVFGPPFQTTGQPQGTLTLTAVGPSATPVASTVTLAVTGPTQSSSAPFPSTLNYVITAGTGTFAGATGIGTIAVTLGAGQSFTFVITST